MSAINEDDPTRAKLLSAYFDGKFSIEELAKLSDKQAEAVDRVIEKAIELMKVDENTSDGYHTFKELYHYRALYNAAFFNEYYHYQDTHTHKSLRHSDGEECFGGGWFIVMTTLPTGQISNHYPMEYWRYFHIPEQETADVWDGHTPEEAAERLETYLRYKKWGSMTIPPSV